MSMLQAFKFDFYLNRLDIYNLIIIYIILFGKIHIYIYIYIYIYQK